MKKKFMGIIASTAVFAAIALPLAACDGNEAKPEHIAAVAADCTHDGNIEYWKSGDKYYADEALTSEIALSDTVDKALGHDFINGEYGKDDAGHWKVCVRCDAADAKQDHVSSGTCVCGYEAGGGTTPTSEYEITIAPTEHGSVTASAEKAEAGEEITLTVTPNDGYELSALDYNGNDITVEQSFAMPAEAVTVTATFAAVEYDVTYDLDGGEGDVPDARYHTDEKFYLPSAVEKEAASFAGWSDGTDTFAAGAQYVMPAHDVAFTALWNEFAEYTFDVVNDGAVNENVTLKPGSGGFIIETGHIGGVAKNIDAAIVFDVEADVAGEALLYFTVCDRQGEFTFDDAYTLTVNDAVVSSDTDMSKGGTDWATFNDWLIANLTLMQGKNRIVISVKDTGALDIAGNVKGIKLKSDTVECSPYTDPDKTWTNETVLHAIADGALASGVVSNGYANSAEDCIGNMQEDNSFVKFTVQADADTTAALWLEVCNRPLQHGFCDVFGLYINGKPVTCYAQMPTGRAEWTDYDLVRLGLVDLKSGVPSEIAIIGKGVAYNIRGIKLVTETEQNIAYSTEDVYGYASEWNNADIAFVTENGGVKSIVSGIKTSNVKGGAAPGIDGGSVALGNLSSNVGATVSFTVNSTAKSRAVLFIDACHRGSLYYFSMAFELKVNGKTVFSPSIMPKGGADWTEYAKIALAEIELDEGDNEISFTVISAEGGIGCNVAGMSFKTEQATVTLI